MWVHENYVVDSLAHTGQVRRYHTWPVLHQQTLAEHCWGVVEIYRRLFGWPRPDVVEHMLFHDAGEIKTGDLPYMAKRDSPELRAASNHMEEVHRTKLVGHLAALTSTEFERFKFADMAELCEFGKRELVMGNGYASSIIDNGITALEKRVQAEPGTAWMTHEASRWLVEIERWREEHVRRS